MAQRNACGKHSELAANEAVRVTQCPCGSVHVTILANGVTVRVQEAGLKAVTRGLMTALDKIEEAAQASVN
jgi:hypothetical protein